MITTKRKAVYGLVALVFFLTFISFVSAQSNRWEVCTPNTSWCGENNEIVKCSVDGEEYNVINECKTGEICVVKDAEPQCVSAKEESNLLLYFFIGVVLLALLIIVILLMRKKKRA